MPRTEADFQADMDLDTLVRAQEIQKDAGRMARVKSSAEQRKEQAARIAADLRGSTRKGFNGMVKNSKMTERG